MLIQSNMHVFLYCNDDDVFCIIICCNHLPGSFEVCLEDILICEIILQGHSDFEVVGMTHIGTVILLLADLFCALSLFPLGYDVLASGSRLSRTLDGIRR